MTFNDAQPQFSGDEAYWIRSHGHIGRPQSPVLISVPHAGRDYPHHILKNSRLPQNALQKLEDRYADQLVNKAIENEYVAIIARAPRAWIDLNRDPIDLDFRYIANIPVMERRTLSERQKISARNMKSPAGLGLIPSRLSGYGEIWRSAWQWHDIKSRIGQTHHSYHSALSHMLLDKRTRHDCAILLDIHSMPSLPKTRSILHQRAQIVLGNRHGETADYDLLQAIEKLCRDFGLQVDHNIPYAGGYILSRHHNRPRNIQALQIEFDRALYLDQHGELTAEASDMQQLVLDIANMAHDYALAQMVDQAAE